MELPTIDTTSVKGSGKRKVSFKGSQCSRKDFPSNETKEFCFLKVILKVITSELKRPTGMVVLSLLASKVTLGNGSLGVGIPLGLGLLVALLKNSLEWYIRHTKRKKINNEVYQVWNGVKFEPKKRKSIKVGDVVLLEHNEKVPAHVLVLRFAPSFCRCFTDESKVTGVKDFLIKKPVRDTYEFINTDNAEEVPSALKNLELSVKVDQNLEDHTKFEGKLKVKGYPQAYKLSLDNLLLKDSVFCSLWLLGIVLYTGKEASICSEMSSKKPTTTERLAKKVTWFLLGLYTAGVCLLAALENNYGLWESVFFYLDSLCSVVPIYLWVVLDLVKLVQTFRLRKLFLRCNTLNLNEDLGRVNHVLMDKAAIVSKKGLQVNMCCLGPNVFYNKESEEQLFTFNQLNFTCGHPETQNFIEDKIPDLNLSDLKQSIKFGNWESVMFLKALALCNLTISMQCRRLSREEDYFLEWLAKDLGARVTNETNQVLTLQIDSSPYNFKILANQPFQSESLKTRIFVEDSGSYYLLVRGPKEEMLSHFSQDSFFSTHVFLQLNSKEFEGQRLILYGFRELSESQMKAFCFSYNNAKNSLIRSEKRIEEVFGEYEENLQYIGMVGAQEQVTAETKEFVGSLKTSGARFWMFSSDTKERTKSLAVSAEIVKESCPVYELNNVEEDLKVEDIENSRNLMQLNSITRRSVSLLESPLLKSAYSLELNGSQFEAALLSQGSTKRLLELIFEAEVVIFSGFSPYQKSLVGELLKNFDQGVVSLGVAKSQSDLAFVRHANIKTVLEEEDQIIHFCQSVDFSLETFSQLKPLIELWGKLNLWNLRKVVSLYVYLTCMFFSVKIYCSFTIGIDEFYTWSDLVYLTSLLPLVFIGAYDKSGPETPGVLGFVFEGILHGAISVSFVLVSLLSAVNSKGYTEHRELGIWYCNLVVYLTATTTYLFQTSKFSFGTLLGHLTSFLVLALAVLGSRPPLIDMILECHWLVVNCLLISLINFKVSYIKKLLGMFFARESIPKKDPFTKSLENSQKSKETTNKKHQSESLLKHSIDNLKLRFRSKKAEKKYTQEKLHQNVKRHRLFFLGILIISIGWQIWSFEGYGESFATLVQINTGLTGVLCCLMFLPKLLKFVPSVFSLYGVYLLVVASVLCSYFAVICPLVFSLYPLVFFMVLHVEWVTAVCLNTACFLAMGFNSYFYYSNLMDDRNSAIFRTVHHNILGLGIISTAAVLAYKISKKDRKIYSLTKRLRSETKKLKEILNFLFPSFVADCITNQKCRGSSAQPSVTVVFCNFCDFEKIVETLPPQELTELIDSVYRKFDNLCKAFGVAKIETVGYTYLACAGINEIEGNMDPEIRIISHARRSIELGLAMIREVQGLYWTRNNPLKLKIGIHSGSVTAGVAGYHKPQFALVGDTVNTASRMASTLEVSNCIQISNSTFLELEDFCGLDFQSKNIQVKGKGLMQTYLVSPSDGFSSGICKVSLIAGHKDSNSTSASSSKTETKLYPELKKMNSPRCHKYTKEEINYKTKASFLGMFKLSNTIFFFGIGTNILVLVAEYLVTEEGDLGFRIAMQLGVQALVGLFSLLMKKHWKKARFAWFYQLFLFAILQVYSGILIFGDLDKSNAIVFCLYMILLMTHCSLLKLPFACLFGLVSFVSVMVLQYTIEPENYFKYTIITLFFLSTSITLFYREKQTRALTVSSENLNTQLESLEQALSRLMPEHVYQNLKQEVVKVDRFNQTTLLYADIVGFTSWSSGKDPAEIVGMLSDLFTKFDTSSIENGVYKVHTIGDCYVVLGVTGEDRNPVGECLNVINFAKEMIKHIQTVNQEQQLELNMRIGVHVGEVTGAIMGTSIVRYDIFGEDVIIANEIESGGVPGQIVCSQSVKDLLQDNCSFEEHSQLSIEKLQRTVKTFKVNC